MICWKQILVTGMVLCVSTTLLMAQPATSTFERLRKAALDSQKGAESVPADHPLAPANRKSAETQTKNPFETADAPETPVTKPESTLFDEMRTPVPNMPTSVIIQASHDLEATPAVHEVEKPEVVHNPAGGNVIHAAYSPKENQENKIIQVKSSVLNEPASQLSLDGQSTSAFPQTASGNPHVSVEWTPRSEILVGEECAFDLVVTNHGDVAVEEIEVDAFFPQTVRLTAARPKPSSAEDRVTWKLDTLAMGEKQVLSVKLIPSRRVDLSLPRKFVSRDKPPANSL